MPINMYDPRTMLAAIKQMMPAHTFLKDLFFSGVQTFTSEVVDVDYYKGRRKMAPFVSPRIAGKVREREGFTTKTFKPALIKPSRILTPDDLQKRSMGEHIYSGKSPDERAAEMMAQDILQMDDEITRREEWMVREVLFTGKVRMLGDGVDQELDYGFTNKTTLTSGAKWDAYDTSDPIADLKAKRLSLIQGSGITPDVVIMASDVVDVFINHPRVQKVLDNRRIELGKIEPRTLPNGVTYIGQISSLGLDIYSYDEWYVDEDANSENTTETPMVPSGNILMASTRARASMLYGAITVLDDNGAITYEGARIPRSWTQKEPSARFIQINSRPLPVPHEVDSWYVLKVI